MSEQPSGIKNPQILIAVIGAITTVVVTAIGVLPTIINSTRPTPTVAPIVVTATPIPTNTPASTTVIVDTATSIPTNIPTEITLIAEAATIQPETPTPLPVIQVPTTAPAPSANNQNMPPNVRLMYDGVSFTLLNESGSVMSLEGILFRGGGREWEARKWGPSIYTSLPAGKCLRLRDAAAGQRQPPPPCQGNIYGLIEVGTTAFFWQDVESFEVFQNGTVIATCPASDGAGECELHIGS